LNPGILKYPYKDQKANAKSEVGSKNRIKKCRSKHSLWGHRLSERQRICLQWWVRTNRFCLPSLHNYYQLWYDTVDNITNQIIDNKIIDNIGSQNQESINQDEIKIIKDEQNPKDRVIKIRNYVKSKPELFINIEEKILRAYLSSGQTIG
jgi:hypothetical protein